jgi:hypothetical protein
LASDSTIPPILFYVPCFLENNFALRKAESHPFLFALIMPVIPPIVTCLVLFMIRVRIGGFWENCDATAKKYKNKNNYTSDKKIPHVC